jgi:hypothetical protein
MPSVFSKIKQSKRHDALPKKVLRALDVVSLMCRNKVDGAGSMKQQVW